MTWIHSNAVHEIWMFVDYTVPDIQNANSAEL